MKILTIGSATFDVFVSGMDAQVVPLKKSPKGLGECFALGSKVDIHSLYVSSGGGATNAAATFQHLGYRCTVVAKVGKDLFGDAVIADLRKRGIETRHVNRDPKLATAYATILSAPKSDRTILIYRGASENLQRKDLPKVSGFAGIYVTSLGGNLSLAKDIFSQKKSAKIFWNPGSKELAKGTSAVARLMKMCDVVNLNAEEAAMVTMVPKTDIRAMLQKLHGWGVRVVVITDGEHGARCFDGKSEWFIPAIRVKVANETGAGDAFGSGFAAAYLRDKDIETALKVGMLNAAGVIQKVGAKNGLLSTFPSSKVLAKVKIQKNPSR